MSWNHEMNSHRKFYIFKDKTNPAYEFVLDKVQGPKSKVFQACSCSYFVTVGLPCSHLFHLAREKPKEVDLKKIIRERWLKCNSFERYEDTNLMNALETEFGKKESKILKHIDLYCIIGKESVEAEEKKEENEEITLSKASPNQNELEEPLNEESKSKLITISLRKSPIKEVVEFQEAFEEKNDTLSEGK